MVPVNVHSLDIPAVMDPDLVSPGPICALGVGVVVGPTVGGGTRVGVAPGAGMGGVPGTGVNVAVGTGVGVPEATIPAAKETS